jgi:hypothetical protein
MQTINTLMIVRLHYYRSVELCKGLKHVETMHVDNGSVDT